MNHAVRTFAFLALAAVAVAQDATTLRRVVQANTADVYTISSKSTQLIDFGMGEQDITVDNSMKLTMKYGAVDKDGNADVEMVLSDFQMKTGGSMGAMMGDMSQMMPKEFKVTGKLDPQNNLNNTKTQGLGMREMMMMGSQMMGSMSGIIFPKSAVKPGDTWQMPVPDQPMMGLKGASMTATFVGAKNMDGTAVYEIKVGGKLPTKVNMAEMMKNAPEADQGMMPADLVITGTVDIKSTAWIEQGSGRLVKMDTSMKTAQKMDMGGQGMSGDIKGDVSMTMALKK